MNWLRMTLVGCVVVGLVGCGSPTTGKKESTKTEKSSSDKGGEARSTEVSTSGVAGDNKAGTGASVADYKDKIVGTWELVKAEDFPPGSLIDFKKDGKVKITVKQGDKETIMDGTYTVEGDKFTVEIAPPGGKLSKNIETITKLTDTEMTMKDSKGKTEEYKKKK